MKDPLAGALAKSLQDENAAVDDRFARAESVLGGGQRAEAPPRHAKAPPRKKKIKVIRDTFSFPEFDYALLAKVQQRCLDRGHNASKSEVVRAGLTSLARMSEPELLEAVRAIQKLKPGRGKDSG